MREKLMWSIVLGSTMAMPAIAPAAWGIEAEYAEPVPPADPVPGDPERPSAELPSIPVSVADDHQNPSTDKRPLSKSRVIEEIVVTAQRREENIQNVPISIQAFSGDALEARGIEATSGLGQTVPSLQFTEIQGFSIIYLRGLGTDIFIPSADPSVATYVDGIYIPQGTMSINSLAGVKRVEVLKGPQGTLFGRNVTGGAISVTTEEPGNELEASAEAQLSNFDGRSVSASLSMPLTDWVSAGIAGVSSEQDSYYTNVNYAVPRTKLDAARLKVNFHPLDEIALALTGYVSDQQSAGTTIGNNIDPSLLGSALGIQSRPDNYQSTYDFPIGGSSNQRILYGTFTWNLPWSDFKALGSKQRIEATSRFDFDSSPVPAVGFTAGSVYQEVLSGELQLLSNADSWGAEFLEWVAGYYYFNSSGGFQPGEANVAPDAINAAIDLVNEESGLGLSLPQGLLDIFALFPDTPIGDNGVRVQFRNIVETRSHAAYAQGTYKLADWVDFTLGARFQREKRYLSDSRTTAVNPGTGDVITVFPWTTPTYTDDTLTPKAVVSLHLGESNNQLVYASYTKGFKGGTFNIATIYTPPDFVEPESVQTYELGTKLELLDGSLRLNGAAFWNELKNLQVIFISLTSGGAVRFDNADSARSRGIELDGTWLPLPELNPGLALTANAAYVDAKFKSFPDGKGFDAQTDLYQANLDFSGNRIPRTPEWSGGLGVVQTIDMSNGSLEVGVDGYFNSGIYFDSQNLVEDNAYQLFNARVSYLYAPWNLRVTALAKNLFEERYHIQQFRMDFGTASTLAAPREYALGVKWEF